MPSATVRPTKKRISVFARICADIALKNCALVEIQLSTCMSPLVADRPRDGLGGERIADPDVDARHAADEVEEVLRGAQRDVDVALVRALVAEVEDAGDRQRRRRPARGLQRDLVADRGAEILRELGADQHVDRTELGLAGDDLLRQRDHVEVRRRVDADDRHRRASRRRAARSPGRSPPASRRSRPAAARSLPSPSAIGRPSAAAARAAAPARPCPRPSRSGRAT